MEAKFGSVLALLLIASSSSLISASFSPRDNYLISCGSNSNSTSYGRTFVGDATRTKSLSISMGRSVSVTYQNPPANTTPLYTTARVFTTVSAYEFTVDQMGMHLVRFHFSPFNSGKYNLSSSVFGVSVNGNSIFHHFSTSRFSLREFILNLDSGKAEIQFMPQGDVGFAFLNAIELISAPKNLIPDYGAQSVTRDGTQEYNNLTSRVLETVHRVNVGGQQLTPFNDTLWRSWVADDDYLVLKSAAKKVSTRFVLSSERLARALQESLHMESPHCHDHDHGTTFQPQPQPEPRPFSLFYPSGYRICVGCKSEIGHGRFLSCMGGVWHPQCFRCHACEVPISDYEFSMSGNRPYHKLCYKAMHHPKCDVCENYIPSNAAGLIEYRAHPFWMQKYCPSHEFDKTPRCCSCERMEPRDAQYLVLGDGRRLCLECLDSAIMDTHECQPLYLEIREFYEGLNMKVEQQIPLLLVERQALNEAMEGEKNGHRHLPETRGLCLSEEQTISTISSRPKIGAGYRIMDMRTEPYRLIRRCEVTAVLILFGLPRLLTGSILAHEMMHAWLRLNAYPNLSPEIEEGICQVLAHLWLDSEIISSSGSSGSSSSSSSASSSSPPASSSSSGPAFSKKGKRSEFEKKVGEFFKHQIETDSSAAYGDGFRRGNEAVNKYGLRSTLDHIRLTGTFPI